VRPGGAPVLLDLKEAAAGGIGPHGLVVGATGSGKSELLRTIVAGLAATHPPELLGFVLVDFKGGAAFADLAGLPQVAGLITNLQADLSMVDRARAALQGEQERRQRLLRAAGNLPDLRAYAARRTADPNLPALPHLLVVVDEFGELLDARPDFLDLFMAVGRVGRSLGMHLLLASQRLDEGRLRGLDGHLRYRICLRTFSAVESSNVRRCAHRSLGGAATSSSSMWTRRTSVGTLPSWPAPRSKCWACPTACSSATLAWQLAHAHPAHVGHRGVPLVGSTDDSEPVGADLPAAPTGQMTPQDATLLLRCSDNQMISMTFDYLSWIAWVSVSGSNCLRRRIRPGARPAPGLGGGSQEERRLPWSTIS
jgi:hypothetical protein